MINRKRVELLDFVQKQTIGPGVLGNKYVKLFNESGEPYELLNSPPAKYYSTAILFPEKGPDMDADEDPNTEVSPPDPSATPSDQLESEASRLLNVDESYSSVGNQTYPNNMGITVALAEQTTWEDLEISFSFRVYRKLNSEEIRKIGLRIDMNVDTFNQLNELFGMTDLLEIRTILDKPTLFINFDNQKSNQIRQRLIEAARDLQQLFSKKLFASIGAESKIFKDLSIYQIRARYIKKLKDQQDDPDVTKNLLFIDEFTQFKGHLQNILEIVDGEIWEGREHVLKAEIPVGLQMVLPPGQYSSFLNKGNANEVYSNNDSKLNVNYLLTIDRRDPANKTKYLKIQLHNASAVVKIDRNAKKFYSVDNSVVNERSFFGIEIKVEGSKLTRYRNRLKKSVDQEDEVNSFIYRQFNDYGTGHGCSVTWNTSNLKTIVTSSYLPIHNSPDVDSTPRDKTKLEYDEKLKVYIPKRYYSDDSFLEIRKLSSLSNLTDDNVIDCLKQLVVGYSSWIKEKETHSTSSPNPSLYETILDGCKQDRNRMLRNIDLIKTDSTLIKIFRFMNTAMFIQILHGKKGDLKVPKQGAYDLAFYSNVDANLNSGVPKWRPFQLAFILLNVDGIFSPESDAREIVDLIWFPTGGGKTEAYLSLIALTILFRRNVVGEKGTGTAVIMRYTLRLLAIQQFQRATLLIMALELLRRLNLKDLPLGTDPITIGLWTGVGIAPNNLEDLKTHIDKIKTTITEESHKNKTIELIKLDGLIHQKCPWCNTSLIKKSSGGLSINYFIDAKESYLFCSNTDCMFSDAKSPINGRLPILICDQEIYQNPPALLFGTVDKFAALAHKVHNEPLQDSRRLFGNVASEWGQKTPPYPPDLIIQDELHLISGPLGSATALVEIAIQELCMREFRGKTFGAKIISSTATIRNSKDQVKSLYGKEVNIFPKPGPEADDSFFAFYKRYFKENDPNKFTWESKRGYVGIVPNGHSHMWMQLRLTAICLVHRAIFENENQSSIEDARFWKTMDSYHTVLSYFNSLKELGKTDSQVNTYLAKEVRRVYKNLLYPNHHLEILYTETILKEELTGRLSGDDVKNSLSKVELKLDAKLRHNKKTTPPDFVLATNMISVGLDIPRLNTMIVNSMPRNISEYIQATSRVAREFPGLVITVHHPYRSRDVSHYEKFVEFHQKFYGFVEPVSITPLTVKTMDKFLSLYIAILTRHRFPKLALRASVKSIDQQPLYDAVEKYLIGVVQERLIPQNEIDPFKEWVHDALEQWKAWVLANSERDLVYEYSSTKKDRDEIQLFQSNRTDRLNPLQEKWNVPHSLRSVEEGTVVNIKPL